MQTNQLVSDQEQAKYDKLIRVLAITIPLLVALLFGIRTKIDLGSWTKILPHLNAVLNSLTALSLIAGYIFIKSKNTIMHRRAMLMAFGMGSIFLVSYVLYHMTNESTEFLAGGFMKNIYYSLLISHILLAAVVVPLVLYAVYYGISGQLGKHKKVVKWTLPVWLYVSVSGVIVYLMIKQYY
jgi:putative membrane protein